MIDSVLCFVLQLFFILFPTFPFSCIKKSSQRSCSWSEYFSESSKSLVCEALHDTFAVPPPRVLSCSRLVLPHRSGQSLWQMSGSHLFPMPYVSSTCSYMSNIFQSHFEINQTNRRVRLQKRSTTWYASWIQSRGTIPNQGSRSLTIQQTCRNSFLAVSKQIFTSIYSSCIIIQCYDVTL